MSRLDYINAVNKAWGKMDTNNLHLSSYNNVQLSELMASDAIVGV